jgi:hypothetical protein
VKLDPAAYREQFELARRVEAASARIAQAAGVAGKVQSQLTPLRGGAKGELARVLDDFQARLTDLSGDTPTTNPANAFAFPPRRIESLRWLSGALGELQRMVDGADAAPSPDAREAFARLAAMADSSLAAWQRFSTGDLDSLNRRLGSEGRRPIATGP